MAGADRIDALRSFNRFYTRRLGLVRGGLVKTPHPLAEARVLYELGNHGAMETSELRDVLDVDAGQLSRLLARLESEGLLARAPSPGDARRRRVELTAEGERAFTTLDRRTIAQIGELLDQLPEPHQNRLIAALEEIRGALEPRGEIALRGLEPGDLGWMVERHGVLYSREYGWDESFELLVAQIMGAFRPGTDRGWIATLDGRRAGGVLCVHETDATAKLRTLLVEPEARGHGIGGRLVDAVIEHARRQGHEELVLWTNDILTAARRIYQRAGFVLTSEAPHHAFGHDLVEQTWARRL